MSVGRVLVLGATGMLGHKVLQTFVRNGADVAATTRTPDSAELLKTVPEAKDAKVIHSFDVSDSSALEKLLRQMEPSVVINCVGAIKQRPAASEPIPAITINALLPHRLAGILADIGGRLIHFSTDCVFTGERGRYTEQDLPDARDLYGRTKSLGEVSGPKALTLRTSMIGRELRYHDSLLDWFLRQRGETIRGFTKAWWSGVTANHLADLVFRVVRDHPDLNGLFQVSSGRISKYDLLVKLREAYELDVTIVPDSSFVCDRSLVGSLFESAIGYRCLPWETLLAELVSDPTTYPTLS